MQRRTFAQYVTPRPKPRAIDVMTTLRHFALVTYTIDPDMLQRQLPLRLSPLVIDLDGQSRALLSVVLFKNANFRSAVFPSPSLDMAQINYRAYVIDRRSGEHAIWFLSTLLDGWAFVVPRFVWKMPWRKGDIDIRYRYDERTGRYDEYIVTSTSPFAPAEVSLVQDEEVDEEDIQLPGFPDVETGLVCLTHATKGFFRRTDGKIGLNQVWHEPIPVRPARLLNASFPLLKNLGFVPLSAQQSPHSVLIAPSIEFMSMLPPRVVSEKVGRETVFRRGVL